MDAIFADNQSVTYLVECVFLVGIWHDHTVVFSAHIALDSLPVLAGFFMNVRSGNVRTDERHGSNGRVLADEINGCSGNQEAGRRRRRLVHMTYFDIYSF